MNTNVYRVLAIFSLLFTLHAQAQEAKTIESTVDAVTVYPRGAQISRSATKSLTVGRQFVRFVGLASEMDPATISVSAAGGINILSVSNQTNFLKSATKPKRIIELRDSLKTAEFDHKFNKNMIAVYEEERKMVLSNQNVGWGGNNGEFLIEDLEDLSDFYRDRLADVMLKVMQLEQKQGRLSKDITRLKRQLNEENARLNRATAEILVEVNIPSSMKAEFTLSYLVRSAGWKPAYNVNVMEVDQPLQFSYNAKVFQNTGVDWSDVTLTLTDANPNLNGNKPELHPWRLMFIEGLPRQLMGYSNKMEVQRLDAVQIASDDGALKKGVELEYPVNDAVTQFKIKTRHSIPSNGKEQGINLDVFTIPAKYEYYCAPKVDPTAFLLAKVTDFEQYDLLPGEANLFLVNTYVGKMMINPGIIADTLELSLGRDQSIVVKREKIKEFCETKKLSGTVKESLGIEISVRNTKDTKIQLTIEDQIPVSTNKDISVSLDEAKAAKHQESTGKLRWSKNIMSGETEKMQFKYTVKYPSDKNINL